MSQIKLTSSELHEVITEAVKQILCLEDENQTNNYSIEEVKQLIIKYIWEDGGYVTPTQTDSSGNATVDFEIFNKANDSLAFYLSVDITYSIGDGFAGSYEEAPWWEEDIIKIEDIKIWDDEGNEIPFNYKLNSDEQFDDAILSCMEGKIDSSAYEEYNSKDDAYDDIKNDIYNN